MSANVRGIYWSATTLASGASVSAGSLIADAALEERCDDDSIITDNPVENGSVISDHKYDLPSELELTYAFSPASARNTTGSAGYANAVYQQLLSLKSADILLTVVTGKRSYQNMVIKTLSVTNDRLTENILQIRINCRQMLLATTQSVTISSASNQKYPQKTAPVTNSGTVSLQPGTNYNASSASGS